MARGIGPVPEGLSANLEDFLKQLRLLALDVQAGRVGSLSGSAGSIIGGSPTPGPPGPPGPPSSPYVPDLTPPPTPTGVAVVAGLDFIGVTTDAPTFSEGNGYARTIVYGAQYGGTGPLPTFSEAVQVHEFVGQVGSFPREPAQQWHIWLKWRTNDGVLSTSPAGGANGYQVTTGQNISFLLEALSGAITRSEIDADVWRTDTFAIAPPSGSPLPDILPFVVQTTDQTVNGVLIPAGVYMDAAFIRNLSALVARLGDAWITNAMIQSLAASKILAGSIGVGEYIQSSDYVNGAAGWRIGGDGFAELASAAIRGLITAAQIDTRNLDIRDGAGNVIFSAGQNLAWSRIANAPKHFRVVSRGFNSTTHPAECGLYNADTGAAIHNGARSHMLARVRRSDGVVTFAQYYDVFVNGTDPGNTPAYGRGWEDLASDLNATGNDHWVVVYTFDEPNTNHLSGSLPAAMYRCGASRAVYASSQFRYRSAYILIGLPGCGEGNALYEGYAGTVDNSPDAWLDVAFSVVQGNLLIGGKGSSLFEINAANVSTYIANAAIGTAQVGELNASKITAGSITADRITSAARSNYANTYNAASFTGSFSSLGLSNNFGTILTVPTTKGGFTLYTGTVWFDLVFNAAPSTTPKYADVIVSLKNPGPSEIEILYIRQTALLVPYGGLLIARFTIPVSRLYLYPAASNKTVQLYVEGDGYTLSTGAPLGVTGTYSIGVSLSAVEIVV